MTCPTCNGQGWVIESQHTPECGAAWGKWEGCHPDCPIPMQVPCRDCGGSGEVDEEVLCPVCRGTGNDGWADWFDLDPGVCTACGGLGRRKAIPQVDKDVPF